MRLVADTSALVSLAATPDARRLALPPFLDGYDVAIPEQVVEELDDIAEYEDDHATASRAILDERERITVHDVDLNPEFPLDDGENAAVQLSEGIGAAFLYCDEFNQLALIHASLSDSRLVTTPRLLKAFVVHGDLSEANVEALLEGIGRVRSWDENAYVQQASRLFD